MSASHRFWLQPAVDPARMPADAVQLALARQVAERLNTRLQPGCALRVAEPETRPGVVSPPGVFAVYMFLQLLTTRFVLAADFEALHELLVEFAVFEVSRSGGTLELCLANGNPLIPAHQRTGRCSSSSLRSAGHAQTPCPPPPLTVLATSSKILEGRMCPRASCWRTPSTAGLERASRRRRCHSARGTHTHGGHTHGTAELCSV